MYTCSSTTNVLPLQTYTDVYTVYGTDVPRGRVVVVSVPCSYRPGTSGVSSIRTQVLPLVPIRIRYNRDFNAITKPKLHLRERQL